MELYPIDLALHIVNIVVLYIILRTLLFKPVRKFMAAREERVQAQLTAAAETRAKADQLYADYDEKLSGAQTACEQLLAEGRKQGAQAAKLALEQAQSESAQILSKAKAEAQSQKLRTLDAAKGDLTDLAVDMAGRILRFDDLVKQRVASGGAPISGTKAGTLKTALTCDEEELLAITQKLEQLLGCHLELRVTVDPTLVGGFAAFIDGKVYDFSYSAQLGQLKRKLS